jgi:toxin-antitoxin system PIN domain toxin
MRALLDVNVLIALLDPDHIFHDRAHAWWSRNEKGGWASCPLTENGVVRIMSNPAYSRAAKFAPGDLIERLDIFASRTNHEFWPDDLSLRDKTYFSRDRLHASRTITDIYLLALAVTRRGILATFDHSIPVSAVSGATSTSLIAI